jgi:tetratricopeptide (TPR) repeat protein
MGLILEASLLSLPVALVSQDHSPADLPHGAAQEALPSASPDARRHLERAVQAIGAHDLVQGEAELRLALQADPNLADAYLILADLELQDGKTGEAFQHFQQGLKLNPRSFEGHYNLALAYLREGKRDDGRRELEQATRLNPGNADAAYNLGVLLVEMGKPQDAVGYLRRAEAGKPGRPDVSFNLVRALLASGRRADAREQAARDSKFLGGDFQWNASVGNLFMEAGDPQEAIRYLQRSAELDPHRIPAREQLGAAYLGANRPEDALTALANIGSGKAHFLRANAFLRLHRLSLAKQEAAEAIGEEPDNPRYLILAARLAQYERPQAHALELIDKAIEAAPDWSEAYYSQAVSYYIERRYTDGQRSLDRAIKLDPRSARALFLYGIIQVNEGNNQKAEEYLAHAISLDPANATFRFHMGAALLRDNRASEAQQAFEKAIQLRPRYALPHYQLAKLLLKQGKNEPAEQELLKAIEFQPDLSPAYYQLSRLYAENGQKEKAARALATFNKLKKEFNDEDLLLLEDATMAIR